MSDAKQGAGGSDSAETDKPFPGRRRQAPSKEKGRVRSGADSLRRWIASAVWLVAVVCALFLAVGALLIALGANEDNPVVQFIHDGASYLDGPFSLENGVFTFVGKNAETKSALVNWGIAAVVYLVVGRIVDRIIRP